VDDLLLITNAAAGSNEQDAVDAALEVLRGATKVDVAATKEPEELDDVLAELRGRSVVVAGGDGSLHAVVNALWHLELLGSTRLGLVPLGTGNDFARGVGIPLEPSEASEVIVAGATRRVDLIVDDQSTVVVNNVHLGVGAQASREARKWKSRLGRFGYVAGALEAAVHPDFIRVRVCVDGQDLLRRQRVVQVAIGNGSTVGGGTELIPDADPSDGELDVIVSHAISGLSRLVYALRLRAGSQKLMKEVVHASGRRVEVEGDDFYVTSDGELSGPHRRRGWALQKGAVEMWLPQADEV
jgi:diacylglycerol kinase (ATP)